MILPFSTKINGKPSYFVEKIHSGLLQHNLLGDFEPGDAPQEFDLNVMAECEPKLHTIREDKNNRWKRGVKIDFFINARQKNMFRFAPVLPVVSTQYIFITYDYGDILEITIDGKYILSFIDREEFAKNDGFDSWKDFFDYFHPKIEASDDKSFSGKIIHWTDLRY